MPKRKMIAFQGEHGAYSEEAAHQHFGREIDTLPCRAFEHIFESVENGYANYGVVPVENSLAGSINKAYDLLLDHDLKVHGEILLHINHCLMAVSGMAAQVQKVRSHPQALAQCEGYLNRQMWEAIPWYDTAGSAKDLSENPEENIAVIASRLAAEKYDLEIMEEGIQDHSENYTRFFVIAKGNAPESDCVKTSLVFAVPDIPGALFNALGEFAKQEINLVKLESRPRRNRPWHYVFYIDFEGHYRDPRSKDALIGLLDRCAFVKLLGSYPPAQWANGDRLSAAQTTLLQI